MPNFYRYAVDAGLGGGINSANATDYPLSVWYGQQICSDLNRDGVRFVPADLDTLFKYVVHNSISFPATDPDAIECS